MIDRLLENHLKPIARDYWRCQLWRGLAQCWAALAKKRTGLSPDRPSDRAGESPVARPAVDRGGTAPGGADRRVELPPATRGARGARAQSTATLGQSGL